MNRLIILAALICLVRPVHADQIEFSRPTADQLRAQFENIFDGMTDAQVEAIDATTTSTIAGTKGNCPRFHLIEGSESAEWRDAKMADAKKFKDVVRVLRLDAETQMKNSPSDYCLAAWQIFGPGGLYRRQMLKAK